MLKRISVVFGSMAMVVPLLTVACGSDDGGDGGLLGAGASTTGSGGTTGINLGGNGTGASSSSNRDGGSVDLTQEEVEAIADSACTGWSTEGEELPAVLQLVVDVSGSMEDPAPGGNDNESKWDVTREALRDAMDNLPDSVSVGVLYYPNQDPGESTTPRPVDACVNVDAMLPIGVLGPTGGQQRDDIDQSLDDARTGDLTPTHDAYRYALQEGLIPYETRARKFMLLITDGAPTMRLECIGESGGNVTDQPTQPIIDDIAGAYAQGISTFLIGSPGSERSSESNTDMRPWLSRAAMEGGTAQPNCSENGPDFCHLDMTQEADFAQALSDGLASIVGQVIDSCTFVIPPPPADQSIDSNTTNVIINWGSGSSSLILPDDNGDCSEGWQLNGDGDIVLCSATCDEVKGDANATLQLTFGCTSEDIIPVR